MKTWFLVLVLVVALIVIMTAPAVAAAVGGPPAEVCARLADLPVPEHALDRICPPY